AKARLVKFGINIGVGIAAVGVKAQYFVERAQAAIVHGGRGARHIAQRRSFEGAQVGAVARDVVAPAVVLHALRKTDAGVAKLVIGKERVLLVHQVAGNTVAAIG